MRPPDHRAGRRSEASAAGHGPAVVMVPFGSIDDAARWFRAARFAGNVPAPCGLARADTLDLAGQRVPEVRW